jgi:ElaB/YqjD/DUF883 family membrane-anchored ribosome-binding protein
MQGQNQTKSESNPRATLDQAKEKVEKGIKDLEQRFENSGDNQDLKALKADIGVLREDLTQLFSNVKETAENKAQQAAQSVKDGGEQVGKQVLDAMGQYKDKGGELAGQLEHQVRERPLISVLVAFGLGMMFSRMRR